MTFLSRLPLKLKAAAICFAFLAGSAALNHAVTTRGVSDGYIGAAASGADPNSAAALAHAGGEFRIVVANVLWLTVLDHYHHQYLAEGGDWSHDTDILPIVKAIVTLDPHFIEAYSVGAMILSETHRLPEAADFLQRAVSANPSDWQVAYDRAEFEAWYRKNPKAALPYALAARRLAADPYDQRRLDMFVKTLESDIGPNERPPGRTG